MQFHKIIRTLFWNHQQPAETAPEAPTEEQAPAEAAAEAPAEEAPAEAAAPEAEPAGNSN